MIAGASIAVGARPVASRYWPTSIARTLGFTLFCLTLFSVPFDTISTKASVTPIMSVLSIPSTLHALIPLPTSVIALDGFFTLTDATQIVIPGDNSAVATVGQFLADSLRPSTGFPLSIQSDTQSANTIHLAIDGSDPTLGEEGYTLTVTPNAVMIHAAAAAGLFHGVQTLRQLLPPEIDRSTIQNIAWKIAASTIRDVPRFGWRGTMLDVARHFFGVPDVKRLIDLMAYYKMNRLHLHLTDDQGWRIAINRWPNLTIYGGSTAVNGDPGGFYTQADYAEIVAYAEQRFIIVVPEIDMPGHTNAALASYPELNCNDTAPALYTGTHVGFSTFCVPKEVTYRFIDDVIGEIAALTPGPYIHVGGDESAATAPDDYLYFVERVQAIVQAHGKRMIGWEEVSQVKLLPTTLVQQWKDNQVVNAIKQGAHVILSPANHAYLDMKYDVATSLGLNWAGYVNVRQAYEWDPTELIPGIDEQVIAGVEAPLWSETIRTQTDMDQMIFPRLLGVAEIGWSAVAARNWDDYNARLKANLTHLDALGVNYYQGS
jgi:hexosaminidase